MQMPGNVVDAIGIFILGAAAGSMLNFVRYRSIVVSCRELLHNIEERQVEPGVVTYGARDITVALPTKSHVSRWQLRAELQHPADELLTLLGAPGKEDDSGRKLTVPERVEWLQARHG
jgi:hypothetical protein